MHEVRLADLTAMIDRDGVRVVVRKLYAHPDTWSAVLKHIGTGADDWVQLGAALHSQSDGAAREMLEESFGEALGRKASELLALASQGKLKIEEFCIGPDVDDDRYSSYATASRALDSRIAAVRAVTDDTLRTYRDSCLQALGSVGQNLHQFFDSSGGVSHEVFSWLRPGSVARGLVVWQEVSDARLTTLMDERHDEDAVVAQKVDDAPGVGGDLAQVRVVDLGDLATRPGWLC